MNKRVYYTNGKNEVRIAENETPPAGWWRGRVKSTITTLGKKWYTDGIYNVLLSDNDSIPTGYFRGRTMDKEWHDKATKTLIDKQYIHYTDGVNEIFLTKNELPPKGFYKGRPKMSIEQKQKLSVAHMGKTWTQESKDKSDNTKRKNNSFNTSEPEKSFYKKLCEKYKPSDIKRNYKSEKYPFRCDFYIVSEDKYIELNLHWTHGNRPYDSTDESCKQQLLKWQEKAKVSKFYKNAIYVWTELDVRKQKIAKQNNLNYIALYKI